MGATNIILLDPGVRRDDAKQRIETYYISNNLHVKMYAWISHFDFCEIVLPQDDIRANG
jgi:hypothetical protein